jgi:hypothetical protein
MPRAGLDPSWVMSMNEGVADHMRIGHDVIFMFGPYAAVYRDMLCSTIPTSAFCRKVYIKPERVLCCLRLEANFC